MKTLTLLLMLSTCAVAQNKDSVFTYITKNYFDTKESSKVALITVEDLEGHGLTGDSLLYLTNRIARAKRKDALGLTQWLTKQETYEGLHFDNLELRALLYMDSAEYDSAIAINKQIIQETSLPRTKAYNYMNMSVSYKRLINREEYKAALDSFYYHATLLDEIGLLQRAKRSLAGYYIDNYELNKAWAIIEDHGEPVSNEGGIRYRILKANYYQSYGWYPAAERNYRVADSLAQMAGFYELSNNAVEGIFTTMGLSNRAAENFMQSVYWLIALLSISYARRWYKKRKEATV